MLTSRRLNIVLNNRSACILIAVCILFATGIASANELYVCVSDQDEIITTTMKISTDLLGITTHNINQPNAILNKHKRYPTVAIISNSCLGRLTEPENKILRDEIRNGVLDLMMFMILAIK